MGSASELMVPLEKSSYWINKSSRILWQVECSNEEYRQLIARHRRSRTISAIATTSGNALLYQLLNPGCSPVANGHVCKHCPTGGRWHIAAAMLGSQEEHRHLISSNNCLRTVIGTATSLGNPFCCQLFNPSRGPVSRRYIMEHDTTGGWRRIIAAMLCPQ